MRLWVLVLAAVLAFAVAPAAAQEMRRLSFDEVQKAFDGQFACRSPDPDGSCSSMIQLVASDASSLTVRETGLNVISALVDAPLSQRARNLALYAQYADLFTALEVQRARGGFRYLKHYETATGRYDPSARAFCMPVAEPAEGVARLEFFFSNSTLADTSADEPLDPSLEDRLREFMVAVMLDPEFRSYLASDPIGLAELDVLVGTREYCVAYAGRLVGGQMQLRGILANSGDVVFTSMNDTLEIRPISESVMLTE